MRIEPYLKSKPEITKKKYIIWLKIEVEGSQIIYK